MTKCEILNLLEDPGWIFGDFSAVGLYAWGIIFVNNFDLTCFSGPPILCGPIEGFVLF